MLEFSNQSYLDRGGSKIESTDSIVDDEGAGIKNCDVLVFTFFRHESLILTTPLI